MLMAETKTEKKIYVRAWYLTGPPANERLKADFVGSSIRRTGEGVFLTANDAWGGVGERFFSYSNIEKIWEENEEDR